MRIKAHRKKYVVSYKKLLFRGMQNKNIEFVLTIVLLAFFFV